MLKLRMYFWSIGRIVLDAGLHTRGLDLRRACKTPPASYRSIANRPSRPIFRKISEKSAVSAHSWRNLPAFWNLSVCSRLGRLQIGPWAIDGRPEADKTGSCPVEVLIRPSSGRYVRCCQAEQPPPAWPRGRDVKAARLVDGPRRRPRIGSPAARQGRRLGKAQQRKEVVHELVLHRWPALGR